MYIARETVKRRRGEISRMNVMGRTLLRRTPTEDPSVSRSTPTKGGDEGGIPLGTSIKKSLITAWTTTNTNI